tara:strand:- start:1888 stop:3723 length:1836 start_codon:yes stop_codon:yes gene_type:complete
MNFHGLKFDTLDDFCDTITVEDLDRLIISPIIENAVGVLITGTRALAMGDGYWGKPICLPGGENLQLRQFPIGRFGKRLEVGETRVIATRTSGASVFRVTVAILFKPTFFAPARLDSTQRAHTAGCRGVHILLPSLLNKHSARRNKMKANKRLDLSGYHAIRPSCTILTKPESNSFVTTSGNAYLVMAAHMCGMEYPDPERPRVVNIICEKEYERLLADFHKRLTSFNSGNAAAAAVSSANRITEILGAEGVVSMMCNDFFDGALPDQMHSPMGVSLIIVMAMRIACYPEHFGVHGACTKQDAFSNIEFGNQIGARWCPVAPKGFIAIDVVCDSALRHARAHASQLPHDPNADRGPFHNVYDNLVFWQRTGQRIVSNIVASPCERALKAQRAAKTDFGESDLTMDPIAESKYRFLGKEDKIKPFKETDSEGFDFASKPDIKNTVINLHDNVETWLRTGMYGDVRLSAHNVNVARMPKDKCKSFDKNSKHGQSDVTIDDSESDEDDVDEILDTNLCMDAITTATGIVHSLMVHGARAVHQFGLETFLVGKGCKNSCADCNKEVDVLKGFIFSSTFGECVLCNRRRCYECTRRVAEHGFGNGCLRCSTTTNDR